MVGLQQPLGLGPVFQYERDRMREAPDGRAVMRQTWRDLVFLHYSLEPNVVQDVLPAGLTVDVFPDASGKPMAWVGLVAFRIEGIRLLGLPPLPLLSAFDEVNVRTYVHLNGSEPSVYFLSLDGGPWLTRAIAGAWYKVPYRRADVELKRDGSRLAYESRRQDACGLSLRCEVANLGTETEAGTLERFLTDRYQLFASNGRGIWRARVAHRPYRLGPLREYECETDLPEAAGIPGGNFVHACWCREVVADFFAPSRVRA